MDLKRNFSKFHFKAWIVILLAFSLLAACSSPSAQPTVTSSYTPSSAPSSTPLPTGTAAPTLESTATSAAPTVPPTVPPTACALAPILVPTLPAVIPGYTELDTTTNLHMTGTYQVIDLPSYRLEITGKVEHPLIFSYDDLRCMPKVTQHLVLNCPGYFTDEATWSGVPLDYLLKLAVIQPKSDGIRLVSADGYYTAASLEDVRTSQPFLAYEWEGQPLPILHGFPVRAVFPGQSGKWVKWLVKIEVY